MKKGSTILARVIDAHKQEVVGLLLHSGEGRSIYGTWVIHICSSLPTATVNGHLQQLWSKNYHDCHRRRPAGKKIWVTTQDLS